MLNPAFQIHDQLDQEKPAKLYEMIDNLAGIFTMLSHPETYFSCIDIEAEIKDYQNHIQTIILPGDYTHPRMRVHIKSYVLPLAARLIDVCEKKNIKCARQAFGEAACKLIETGDFSVIEKQEEDPLPNAGAQIIPFNFRR